MDGAHEPLAPAPPDTRRILTVQQAVGVVPNEKGGVKVLTKKTAATQHPGKLVTETVFHGGKSNRK